MKDRGLLRGVLLPLALVAVTACGSSGGAGEESTGEDAAEPTTNATATQTETSSADGEELDPVELTLGLMAGRRALTTGFWVAIAEEQGFLEEENVTVDTVDFTSGGDVINGLMSGDIHIAHMGSEGIIANAQGGDTIGIADVSPVSVWAVVAGPDATWDNLAGSTVGTSGLTTIPTVVFRQVVSDAGYDPDSDFEYVVVGSTPETYAALTEDQVQVIPGSAPFIFAAADQGYSLLGYAAPDSEIPFISAGVITTTRTFADENREAVVRWMRVMHKVATWSHDPANRESLIDIAAELTGQDRSVAQRSIEQYFDSDTHGPHFLPPGLKMNREAVQNAIDAYIEIGAIEGPIPVDDFVDDSFAEEALESLGASG